VLEDCSLECGLQIIISFMSFEVILVLEICAESWVRRSPPSSTRRRCRRCVGATARASATELCVDLCTLQDIAGDAFCFVTVRKQSHKGWVNRMLVPYVIFFVLACVTSLAGMVVKAMLLYEKFESRQLARQGQARRALSLGKMRIKEESLGVISVKHKQTVDELQAKFDAHKLSRRQDYCALLAVVFEDIPMGTLNTLYLL
jgi:hypothetical protein